MMAATAADGDLPVETRSSNGRDVVGSGRPPRASPRRRPRSDRSCARSSPTAPVPPSPVMNRAGARQDGDRRRLGPPRMDGFVGGENLAFAAFVAAPSSKTTTPPGRRLPRSRPPSAPTPSPTPNGTDPDARRYAVVIDPDRDAEADAGVSNPEPETGDGDVRRRSDLGGRSGRQPDAPARVELGMTWLMDVAVKTVPGGARATTSGGSERRQLASETSGRAVMHPGSRRTRRRGRRG